MRVFIIICGIIASLITGLFLLGWIASHRQLKEIKPYITYTRLMYLAGGCDKYQAQYGKWPDSLAQLQSGRPELVDPWDKDAWGREVVLVPYDKSLGYGEVVSYGSDGKVSGTGANRDLLVRFPCAANTNWNEQMGAGLKKPRFNP